MTRSPRKTGRGPAADRRAVEPKASDETTAVGMGTPMADDHELEPLEPMYTEEHAARLLGITPRSLRTERENERIGYKPVAGKIMYRHSDLVRWQKRGVSWRAEGRLKAQSSSSSQDG